jgi:hypothetical protein
MIAVTLVSSANERPGRVARVGSREMGEQAGENLYPLSLPPLLQAFMKNIKKI